MLGSTRGLAGLWREEEVTITSTDAYEAILTLISYMAEEVLPHAAAEEAAIYPAAAAHPELADTVGAMTTEHKTLSAAASQLAGFADGAAAAEQARQIAELFTSHAAKENDASSR